MKAWLGVWVVQAGPADGCEGVAVDGRRAEALKLLAVEEAGVALVLAEIVAGPAGVHVGHEAVAGDLGGDGGGGDGVADAVAAGDGGYGEAGFVEGEVVDEEVMGLRIESVDGSDHRQAGGGDDAVLVNLLRAGGADGDGEGVLADVLVGAFALLRGELLAVVDAFEPFSAKGRGRGEG